MIFEIKDESKQIFNNYKSLFIPPYKFCEICLELFFISNHENLFWARMNYCKVDGQIFLCG